MLKASNCTIVGILTLMSRKNFILSPEVIKLFFVLNSAEHKILNAHKYKKIKKFSIFQAQIKVGRKLRMPFFLLINVEMPTIVGILTFMSD